jgi:hypothetical protein
MCGSLVMLTELEASRYTSQCEHGMLYLTWDHVMIQFSRQEFVYLAETLQTLPCDDEAFIARTSLLTLSCDGDGQLSLYIRQVGLRLSLLDFHFLSGMIYVAVRMLNAAFTTISPAPLPLIIL